jgi:hypothetical protein
LIGEEEPIKEITHIDNTDNSDLKELKELSNDLNNRALVPVKKLPISLFDLKNLLESSKSTLMPSHSIYTINMEKTVCSMWHESEDDDNFVCNAAISLDTN